MWCLDRVAPAVAPVDQAAAPVGADLEEIIQAIRAGWPNGTRRLHKDAIIRAPDEMA